MSRHAGAPSLAAAALMMAALAAAGGCGAGDRERVGMRTDTIGGVLHILNAGGPAGGTIDLRSRVDLTIGAAFGDRNYTFGQVWDVVVGPNASIFVLDVLRDEVLAYDSAGRFIRSIGRRGDGPGEFRWPARGFWMNGRLAVWDKAHYRLSFFSRAGALVADTLRTEWGDRLQEIIWTPGSGYLIQAGPSWRSPPDPDNDGIARLLRFDAAGSDTLLVWSDTSATVTYRAPGISSSAAVPFAVRASWSPRSAGGFFFTRGDAYEIIEYGPELRVERVLRRDYARFPLSREELDGVRRRVARLDRELRSQVVLPELKPAIAALQGVEGGGVLVHTFGPDDRSLQRWDLLDCSGRFAYTLLLPPRFQAYQATRTSLYGEWRDTLGVTYIQRYRLPPLRKC